MKKLKCITLILTAAIIAPLCMAGESPDCDGTNYTNCHQPTDTDDGTTHSVSGWGDSNTHSCTSSNANDGYCADDGGGNCSYSGSDTDDKTGVVTVWGGCNWSSYTTCNC